MSSIVRGRGVGKPNFAVFGTSTTPTPFPGLPPTGNIMIIGARYWPVVPSARVQVLVIRPSTRRYSRPLGAPRSMTCSTTTCRFGEAVMRSPAVSADSAGIPHAELMQVAHMAASPMAKWGCNLHVEILRNKFLIYLGFSDRTPQKIVVLFFIDRGLHQDFSKRR